MIHKRGLGGFEAWPRFLLGVVLAGIFCGRAWAIETPSSAAAIHDTLNHFDSAVQELKDERDALRQEIDSLKSEQETMIDGVKARLDMADDAKAGAQKELTDAQVRIDSLENEKGALVEKLDDKLVAVDRYTQVLSAKDGVIERIQGEAETFAAQLDKAEKLLAKSVGRIQKLEADNETLEKEVETLRAERKKILFGYDDELTVTKLERDKLAQQMAFLQEKQKVAESRLSLLEQEKNGWSQRAQEAATKAKIDQQKWEDRIFQAQKEMEDLVREHKAALAEAQRNSDEMERKLKSVEKERDSFIAARNSAADKLRDEIKSKDEELIGFRRELQAAKESLAAAQASLKAFQDAKAGDRDHFKDQLDRLQEKVDIAQAAQGMAEQKLARTEAALKTAQEESIVYKPYQKKAIELEAKLKDTSEQLAGVRLQLKTAQDASERYKNDQELLLSQLRSDYEKDVVVARDELRSVRDELKAAQEAARRAGSESAARAQDDAAKIADLEKKLQDSTRRADEAEAQATSAQKALDSGKKEYEGRIRDLEAQLSSLENRAKKSDEQAARRAEADAEKIADLEKKYQGNTRRAVDAETQLSLSLEELANQKKDRQALIKEYETKLGSAEGAQKMAESKLAALTDEKEALLEKIDVLNNQILATNVAMSKNIALEKDNRNLKTGMDNLAKTLSETDAKYKALITQSEADKGRWSALEKEYSSKLDLIDKAKASVRENEALQERAKVAEAKLKKLLDNFVKTQDENELLKQDARSRINPREFKETMERNSALEKEAAALRVQTRKQEQALAALKEKYDALFDEAKSQKQKLARMDSHLKEWDAQKEEWTTSQVKTKAVLETKEEKLGAVSDSYRKVVDENKRLLEKIGSFPKDLSDVNARAEKLAKENSLLHYNLGVIYTEKELYPEAIREFEKALESRPDDPYAHYNLGIIYSQYVVDEDRAVEHFQKYLKIAPNDKDADMARKYVFVRESYNDTGTK